MQRIIFHIDVNNAFLSWTAVDLLNNGFKYDIRESYSVIGGDPTFRSGIVLAKSTKAKKVGVYTSQTLYSAKKVCPALKVYPPNYAYYSEMSNKLFKLLSKYSPDIEIASIDECYLDYTKVKNLYGDQLEFAQKIQKEIFETLKFTVNIGIANNKLCAKMASDFSKPNKIHTLYDNEVQDKMWPLPVVELFGVGKKSVIKLNELKIFTIKDLANSNPEYLSKYFKNQAVTFINLANGIDNNEVISESSNPKGISNETTLKNDINKKELLYPYLMYLSEKVALRVRKQKKYASVIAVILKDNYFKRKTHQRKLKNATNITSEIYAISKEILDEMWNDDSIRLIGIRLDDLTDVSNYQISLFEDHKDRNNEEKLEEVVDNLKEKYDYKIITKASFMKNKK